MPSGRRRFHFPSRDEPVDVTAPIHKSVGVTLVVAQGRDKPYPYLFQQGQQVTAIVIQAIWIALQRLQDN